MAARGAPAAEVTAVAWLHAGGMLESVGRGEKAGDGGSSAMEGLKIEESGSVSGTPQAIIRASFRLTRASS